MNDRPKYLCRYPDGTTEIQDVEGAVSYGSIVTVEGRAGRWGVIRINRDDLREGVTAEIWLRPINDPRGHVPS